MNVPRLVQSWNRFILQQIYTQSSTLDKGGQDDSSQGKSPLPLTFRQFCSPSFLFLNEVFFVFTGSRRYWPAGRISSSPLKTAKPNTATELEDISREISAAIDQPRTPMSPVYDEENKNVSIFTQLFGMKQEKVTMLLLLKKRSTSWWRNY